MLLVIDVGNTSTAIAIFAGHKIVWRNRMPTPPCYDDKALKRLLKGSRTMPIQRVACASVVPRLDSGMKKAIRSLLGCPVLWVSHRLSLGFRLGVDRPSQVGADRICGCAGALSLSPPPVLVIDSGTATTFDLIDRRRVYIGGCILPGLEISIRTLALHAAKLRRIAFEVPDSPVATNTADHIRSGIFYGFLGSARYLIEEYKKVLGRGTTVFATGGLSRAFRKRISGIDVHDPDLVFTGLRVLADRNP